MYVDIKCEKCGQRTNGRWMDDHKKETYVYVMTIITIYFDRQYEK